MKTLTSLFAIIFVLYLTACSSDDDSSNAECSSDQVVDKSRGNCTENSGWSSNYSESISGGIRTITSNNIPDHQVGVFGQGSGSLNPNAISEHSKTYTISANPNQASTLTSLIQTNGTFPNAGPKYAFGILLNGVKLDPIAAEPFPHKGAMSSDANWEWNLEATNVQIGLDCSNAHVQPNGEYHYHGAPTLFLEGQDIKTDKMTLIGYAADGFPIYYKYAYSNAMDTTSNIVTMTSSYVLKDGERPGDGISAPCDSYSGVYSNDYSYLASHGSLDEANGRTGITPEFPDGTYYYMLTEEFPSIPRFFRGTPSEDFKLGM